MTTQTKPAAKKTAASKTAKKKAPAKRPVGRPALYNDDLAMEICRRVENGERLTRICKEPGMPAFGTIWHWENDTVEVNGIHTLKHPKFSAALACARVSNADFQVMEAGDLVDDAGTILRNTRNGRALKDENGEPIKILSHEAIAHARSQANYRQWMAERVVSRYRPKQTVEQTGPNGGPIQTQNANANFDREELVGAFKTLIEKGV